MEKQNYFVVLNAVCRAYKLDKEEVLATGGRATGEVAAARQMFIYLSREFNAARAHELASITSRDSASISYSCNQIKKKLLERDQETILMHSSLYNQIKNEIDRDKCLMELMELKMDLMDTHIKYLSSRDKLAKVLSKKTGEHVTIQYDDKCGMLVKAGKELIQMDYYIATKL